MLYVLLFYVELINANIGNENAWLAVDKCSLLISIVVPSCYILNPGVYNPDIVIPTIQGPCLNHWTHHYALCPLCFTSLVRIVTDGLNASNYYIYTCSIVIAMNIHVLYQSCLFLLVAICVFVTMSVASIFPILIFFASSGFWYWVTKLRYYQYLPPV